MIGNYKDTSFLHYGNYYGHKNLFGINVLHFYFFVTDAAGYQARVLDVGYALQPSLTFSDKARIMPGG